ncbi:hypothetical protein HMPREF9412_1047 [Paenibacillus sp. HGF5]|nr:hypothetical protein HMPREF9412_1047 [Paenibacillus sp. HGF5]
MYRPFRPPFSFFHTTIEDPPSYPARDSNSISLLLEWHKWQSA